MTEIRVNSSRPYTVYIGGGLLDGTALRGTGIRRGGTLAVICDENVASLYRDKAEEALSAVADGVVFHVIKSGETSKSVACYAEALSFLARSGIGRGDRIAALGGGVTGDLAGFCAATYMRGIGLIQLPTSVIAAVDSSVGGKVAVDLPEGKNLAGAFYSPESVICDTDLLKTLPDIEISSGMAEVIKYGALFPDFLKELAEADLSAMSDEYRENIIAKCVSYKKALVERDEFDTGDRRLLNFGHTVGHAIEKLSGYTVRHGHAVAAGMCIVSRAAYRLGLVSYDLSERLVPPLGGFSLPDSTGFGAGELSSAVMSDKKRGGDTVSLIIPSEAGGCRVENININELPGFISAGLTPDARRLI